MKKKTVTALAGLALLVVGLVGIPSVNAGEYAGETPGFVRKPLSRGATTGPVEVMTERPNGTETQEVTIAPGANSGWHVNPGQEVVTVAEGVVSLYAEGLPGCGPAELPVGYADVGDGRPHLFANNGDVAAKLIVTYLDVHGSPVTGVNKPANCPDISATPSGFVRKQLAHGTGAPIHVWTEQANDIVTQHVTLEPGASSGWHFHPGWELVTITKGVLTLYAEDHPGCAPIEVPAGATGTANGRPHLARNDTPQPVGLIVTYFDVPMGNGGPALPTDRPGSCPDV